MLISLIFNSLISHGEHDAFHSFATGVVPPLMDVTGLPDWILV